MMAGGMGSGGQIGNPQGTPAPTGQSVNMNPALVCFGLTGQPIDCTIDTGCEVTTISLGGFQKHFQDKVQIDASCRERMDGVGQSKATENARPLQHDAYNPRAWWGEYPGEWR